jgi:predicted acylesterase/phospholipase RssA
MFPKSLYRSCQTLSILCDSDGSAGDPGEPGFEEDGSGHFRIAYLAPGPLVERLAEQFSRVGADRCVASSSGQQAISFSIGRKLVSRLSRFGVDEAALYGAQVTFYSDQAYAVQDLHRLDPELVLVDERQGQFRFESLYENVRSLSPREFHLPKKRVLVILDENAQTEARSFRLGMAGIRGVLVAPRSAVQIFAFASQELHQMWHGFRRKSICISGGGVEGYVYALGVARALEVAIKKRSLKDFDIYCGVSSGAILASCLAVGVHTDDLIAQIYRRPGSLEPFTPKVVFDFATSEISRRFWSFLKTLPGSDSAEIVSNLQRLVPIGFFKGDRLKEFVEAQLKRLGVKDSFLALQKELYISATDQDTGEHTIFGEEPWRDIRISQAVRASCALPPFYLPERINGHWFADGQLTSSSDFMTAISRGAGLVVLIDPMVAYTSNEPGAVLRRGGFFSTVQAIKSLVQTRAASMWKHAMDVYPDVDFIRFQPTDEVMEAMAGNPMRYRIRTELTELGYIGALQQMLTQYSSHSHKLEKHGFLLRPRSELQDLLSESVDTASTFLRSIR